jgi:hypothetical protein
MGMTQLRMLPSCGTSGGTTKMIDMFPMFYFCCSNKDQTYRRWRTKLFDDSCTSQLRGTRFALNKIKMIVEATGGMEIWATLTTTQRKAIIGAYRAQFPLFSAMSFREFEASAVNIPSIYFGSSPDRLEWKTYFKPLFVEIADAS